MMQQLLPQTQTAEEIREWIDVDATDVTTDKEHLVHQAEIVERKPEVTAHLGALLRRDTKRRLATMVFLPFLPFALLLLLKAVLSEAAWIQLCINPLFLTAALLLCIGGPLALLKPTRKAKEAARRLSTLEDVAAIGGLVETLSFGHDTQIDAPAREALIRLLTQLKASDAGLLKDGHLALLRATLASSAYGTGDLFTSLSRRLAHHARLQIAILKAFEQVGDSQSLPVVTHLAKSAANLGVRNAAVECLPFLTARVEQQRASQTLLRAASATGVAAGMLLRPVSGGYEQAPDEMVRPSNAPDSEFAASSVHQG